MRSSLRFVSYNEAGDHFYQRRDGVILLPKEVLRTGEACRVWPELLTPGYDPIWSYHWHLKVRRLEEQAFVESLSDEQRQKILNTGLQASEEVLSQ